MPQPDYRIHEMNKRLQQRTDDSDNLWWDAFATEFFEDDANLTLTFCLEDGPKRYSNIRFSQIPYRRKYYGTLDKFASFMWHFSTLVGGFEIPTVKHW